MYGLIRKLSKDIPKGKFYSCDSVRWYAMITAIIGGTGTHFKHEALQIIRILVYENRFNYVQDDILCAHTVLIMMALSNANNARIGFDLHQQARSEAYSGANTFNVGDLYFPGIG